MKYAALFALLVAVVTAEPCPVDDLRIKYYSLEEQLWKNVSDPTWSEAGLGGDVELTKAFVMVDDQVQAVPPVLVPRPIISGLLWMKTIEKLNIIDGLYVKFVEFIRRQARPGALPAPRREWLDLSENILMDSQLSVTQAVDKIYTLLEHGNMFRTVIQGDHPDLCELQLSPHQLIYDMYNTVALSEIKGYAMMQFSWMLLRIYGKGNFTQEASLTRLRYAERAKKIAVAARTALSVAKRDVYRCDPSEHKEGETYEQVTRLLQGYIENEVDMNPTATCKENCAHYTYAKHHNCYADQYCSKQKSCKGRILDCNYIDSDMWICPSRDRHRRYDFIEYENGRILGHPGSCPRGVSKVDSWWRWLFWHCSYCMCLCDEVDATSDRYFSLRETTSDMKNSKVVTGIRFVKHQKVFHIQISQGTLGKRASITSPEWVPIQKFDISDPDVVDGQDYHTLTYERRAIDLDEIDSPLAHILTGVRFRMIGAHLHFEIRSTPFNYTTGRLSPERSRWMSNDNTEGSDTPRSKLELVKPDIPTRSTSALPVDSQHDQYVEFTHTDFDADVAQSTVPFIDIQSIEPMKGVALASGAGVVHRGERGSGGFLALKLFTYDFARHVHAEPPPSSLDEGRDEFLSQIN